MIQTPFFCTVTYCQWVIDACHLKGTQSPDLQQESWTSGPFQHEGNTFPQNVRNRLTSDTASDPSIKESSNTLTWKPQNAMREWSVPQSPNPGSHATEDFFFLNLRHVWDTHIHCFHSKTEYLHCTMYLYRVGQKQVYSNLYTIYTVYLLLAQFVYESKVPRIPNSWRRRHYVPSKCSEPTTPVR